MKKFLVTIISLILAIPALAENRVINLVVGYKTVHFTGINRKAFAINNQIPAPTLHFKEGDQVSINVLNLLNEETALHWHGMLVPWQMDGVLGISQQGIQPGQTFHYKFTLHQAGTYWYHAHAGLQEQQGLYGAFIIDPVKSPSYKYNKDFVMVLSDWSNTNPNQILANLKKDGNYYSKRFPLQPSLATFIHDYGKADANERQKLIDDYKMMQQMRMSIYDMSDVAYDAFLLNGHSKNTPWIKQVNKGDIVRLRFIGAAAGTIFHVKIPNTSMKMVHVEGNDVQPYDVNDFTIAPGETYDVLVKIEKNGPYIIYAESMDTLGAAYGALITNPKQLVDFTKVNPFPRPLPVTREMMNNMMMNEMAHGAMSSMAMDMPMDMKMQHAQKPMSDKMPMHDMPQMKMDMSMPMDHSKMNHAKHNMQMMPGMDMSMPMDHSKMNHAKHNMQMMPGMDMSMDHSKHQMNKAMSPVQHRNMQTMNHAMSMNHSMQMPTESTIKGDAAAISSKVTNAVTTPGTKYQNLAASVKTNDPLKPIEKVIKMELFGYMDRFIWFINGVPEYKAKPILLKPGERYRIVFINTSMMHHPMHIHGHWFILRKGLGSYDPLLHTIDVAPGATVVADLDTDASGQWFFHCHLLYHMISGMSRVFQYSTLIELTQGKAIPKHIEKETAYKNRPIVRVDDERPINIKLVKHPMPHPMGLYLANYLDAGAAPFDYVQKISFKGLYGYDYNKLELLTDDAEIEDGRIKNADIDIFYWRLISQFWAIKGGMNYFYRPALKPYWQPGVGIEGLLPYFIDTDIRIYDYSGSLKLDALFSRDTQLTNNLFLRLGLRSILASKTISRAQIGNGLNQMRYVIHPYYRIMPGLNIFAEYEYEKNYGAFKNLQAAQGEPASDQSVTLGFSLIF